MDRFPLAQMMTNEHGDDGFLPARSDQLVGFCKSLSEIECLRAVRAEQLRAMLGVDCVPGRDSISDPAMLPFLDPKVRRLVEDFPRQAADIAREHGLAPEEFNGMLARLESDNTFRTNIQTILQTNGNS
jgi:Domain of unknown function (DUF4168)